MNLKKKLRKFFTLTRTADGGFTLVELIVVIAILGILAGVGTVGYSGYIKNSNKNADKVLVGNIIRAIETGTYSTMFETEDSYKKAALTYPVGVIVLSSDGCVVMESESTIDKTEENCDMVDDTFYKIEQKINYVSYERKKSTGGWTTAYWRGNQTYYELTPVQVRYCRNHTNVPGSSSYDVLGTILYPTGKEFQEGILTYRVSSGNEYNLITKNNIINIADCTGLFKLQDETTGHGTFITKEELVALNSANRVVASGAGSPLYDSIVAAFGSASDLTLKYDAWGDAEDGGHTYPTLVTYTENMLGDIKNLWDDLDEKLGMIPSGVVDLSSLLSDDYENAADMADSFFNVIAEQYKDENALLTAWKGAVNAPVTYNFGLSGSMDNIYGVRIAYNNGFASYCEAHGANPKYLEVIKNYCEKDSVVGLIEIPVTVNWTAFTQDQSGEYSLKNQFVKAGDDGTAFAEYKNLYELYKDSEAYIKNCEIFYDAAQTIAATGSEAYKNGGEEGYFAYYGNMMQEMSAYYNVLETYSGKAVVILVTVENGIVKCEVSPSAANPRN